MTLLLAGSTKEAVSPFNHSSQEENVSHHHDVEFAGKDASDPGLAATGKSS
jgi:hypothetical protein